MSLKEAITIKRRLNCGHKHARFHAVDGSGRVFACRRSVSLDDVDERGRTIISEPPAKIPAVPESSSKPEGFWSRLVRLTQRLFGRELPALGQ